jgi:hypothetical protein
MREEIEGKSIEELIEMQKPCLCKMVTCFCELITREIDAQGQKVRIRGWLRGLREMRRELSELGHLDNELNKTISVIEKESEDYLFLPKKGEK